MLWVLAPIFVTLLPLHSITTLAGASTIAPPPTDNKRLATAAELERLREKIRRLVHDLESAHYSQGTLRSQLRTTEKKIGVVAQHLTQLNRQISLHEVQLTKRLQRLQILQADLTKQRKILTLQIRAAYTIGRQGYLKMLLNQQDPASMGRVMTYYNYFNRARVMRIEQINHDIEVLDRLQNRIREQTRLLQQTRNKRRDEKQTLERTKRLRSRILARLDQDIQRKDQRLDKMLQNEQILVQLLQKLTQALATIPARPASRMDFKRLKGGLAWPATGPILARFGAPRNIGRLRWQGVVIRADEGAEVRAISHGRVAFANWLQGFGQLIIIDHGGGYMTLYGYNQMLTKETGNWVETGEMIATIGNSGGQRRFGVYFEIRHNGKPINPALWCSNRSSNQHGSTKRR